jgi:radical SAM superfamily enzyme YgiQ (UPF0313 family)
VRYEEPVFRPPSEADSYLLQVTIGCSHNECSFCAMYRGKRFRVRSEEELTEDLAMARHLLGDEVRRVFLCDGDAFALSPRRLRAILDRLHETWPSLGRIGSYANARDVLRKSDGDLRDLRERGLGILYFGLESGDDELLRKVVKGATADEIAEAVRRAEAAGIKASVMVLIGLGGREGSGRHARRTAAVVNRMKPRFLSFLTVTPVPGTPFGDEVERGDVELLDPRETLREVRTILEDLTLDGTIFRSNHASNYLPLGGRLPKDKERLLAELDAALEGKVGLRPEWLRGL